MKIQDYLVSLIAIIIIVAGLAAAPNREAINQDNIRLCNELGSGYKLVVGHGARGQIYLNCKLQ